MLSPFWSGAQDHGVGDEVRALVRVLGGRVPEQATAAELAQAGVDPARARRWASTAPRATRGEPITLLDPRYPAALGDVPDAPPVLLVEGDPACLCGPAVAIVGTRGCSAYGAAVARHLGSAVAEAGGVVVSGLARGIDGHAHRGALDHGRTIAVLGHGLRFTAPPAHGSLRRRIAANGGLVLSTWGDHVRPARWTFPRRNRWIAALAEHVVLVEAPRRSGALHTARAALDLDRELLVVPDAIGRSASEGGLELLARGVATPLVDVDRFVATALQTPHRMRSRWLDVLFAGAELEEVARLRGMSLLELLRELSALELRGQVVRVAGRRYAPGARGAP